MGSTSSSVHRKFVYLVTFPNKDRTKEDLKRLDCRMKKTFCRIKDLGLKKSIQKKLLETGFRSSELLCWLNRLIDRLVNSSNMRFFSNLMSVLTPRIEKIRYFESLLDLWDQYKKNFFKKPSEILGLLKKFRILYLGLYFTSVIQNPSTSNETIMMKEGEDIATETVDTDFDPQSYIRDNFGEMIPILKNGDTIISGYGAVKNDHDDDNNDNVYRFKNFGIFRTISNQECFYLPVIASEPKIDKITGKIPYLEPGNFIRYNKEGKESNTLINFETYATNNNIVAPSQGVFTEGRAGTGKFYSKGDVYPFGDYVFDHCFIENLTLEKLYEFGHTAVQIRLHVGSDSYKLAHSGLFYAYYSYLDPAEEIKDRFRNPRYINSAYSVGDKLWKNVTTFEDIDTRDIDNFENGSTKVKRRCIVVGIYSYLVLLEKLEHYKIVFGDDYENSTALLLENIKTILRNQNRIQYIAPQ